MVKCSDDVGMQQGLTVLAYPKNEPLTRELAQIIPLIARDDGSLVLIARLSVSMGAWRSDRPFPYSNTANIMALLHTFARNSATIRGQISFNN